MEPIASPTRSDLLQKINEKKYRVNSDYLLEASIIDTESVNAYEMDQ